MLKKRKLITILIINILIIMLFSIIVNASEVQEINLVDNVEKINLVDDVEVLTPEAEVLPLELEELSLTDDIEVEEENSNFILEESDDNKFENKVEDIKSLGNPSGKIKIILVPILFILALGVLVYRKHEDLSKILLKK